MAKKPTKRQYSVWKRRKKISLQRKFKSPVRGRKISLQEQNEPVLRKLLEDYQQVNG